MSRLDKILSIRLDVHTSIQLGKAVEAFNVSRSSDAIRRAIGFVADNFEKNDLQQFRFSTLAKQKKAIEAFRDALKSDIKDGSWMML